MKTKVRFSFWLAPILITFAAFAQPQPAMPPAADARFQIPATDEGLPGTGPIRRYDWFKKLWLDRRTAWSKRIDKDQHAVVFLGDSITQLWGDDMGGSFAGVKVANRGISGDTTRGVLIRLDDDVLSLHPDAVIILIGTNDLEEGADPETIAANLKLILAKLEAANPKMPIVLCQVFPSSPTKKRPADKIKQINKLYAAAIKGDVHVTLVETWLVFANTDGDAKIEEFPDLLHPNKIGYDKWAAALHPILATLGFMDTKPEPFTPDAGFVSLFNGHDLTGWGYRPTSAADLESSRRWHASDTNAPPWPIVPAAVNFAGQTSSPDDRYRAINGRLVVTAVPEYRRIQSIWTTNDWPHDFVLKLQFRAAVNADSGVFVRVPQLQCRDYLIAGPYKELKRYKPQDWNDMMIEVHGTLARCTCNGEILEEALAVPATGPIGLEGDRGQMEYRNIEISEAP